MMLSAAAWRSTCSSALSLHVGSPRVGAGPFHANSSTYNIVGGAIFNFLGVRHASTQVWLILETSYLFYFHIDCFFFYLFIFKIKTNFA